MQAPTQNVNDESRPESSLVSASSLSARAALRSHRWSLLGRTYDLAPRDRTSRLVKTDVKTRLSSSSNYEQTRRRCESWLGRPSQLTVTHCTFCRCSPRPAPGSGPARRARVPALGLACLCSYVFPNDNHGTLSTSRLLNSSDSSLCAERGSDADPCHRIAARPSPQTSTAPRHPWTSFAFCSLRRGPT